MAWKVAKASLGRQLVIEVSASVVPRCVALRASSEATNICSKSFLIRYYGIHSLEYSSSSRGLFRAQSDYEEKVNVEAVLVVV